VQCSAVQYALKQVVKLKRETGVDTHCHKHSSIQLGKSLTSATLSEHVRFQFSCAYVCACGGAHVLCV